MQVLIIGIIYIIFLLLQNNFKKGKVYINELKSYETYTRVNVDENEIVPIKIFTRNTIDELIIKQINKMPCCEVHRLGKIKGWQVLRLDN